MPKATLLVQTRHGHHQCTDPTHLQELRTSTTTKRYPAPEWKLESANRISWLAAAWLECVLDYHGWWREGIFVVQKAWSVLSEVKRDFEFKDPFNPSWTSCLSAKGIPACTQITNYGIRRLPCTFSLLCHVWHMCFSDLCKEALLGWWSSKLV